MTATTRVLGIDPGETGAAVMLDEGGRVYRVVTWTTCQRDWRKMRQIRQWVTDDTAPSGLEVTGLPMVAVGQSLAARLTPTLLACESQHVARDPRAALRLTLQAGRLLAPLELEMKAEAQMVSPSSWRSMHGIKGLTRRKENGRMETRRQALKRESLTYLPRFLPGLADALDALGHHDHITDAAGIARYAYMHARQKERAR